MVCLRALLLGDIATLHFPSARNTRDGYRDEANDDDGQQVMGGGRKKKGVGYILDRSFGKVSEVASPEKGMGLLPASSSLSSLKQPTTATDSGLRRLQLSLEEAFYLAHVDECVGLELALATPRVVVPTAGATTLLPSPTRRKRHLDDEHPRLPHCHQQGQYDDGDDAGGGPTTFKEAGVGCDLIPSGGISGGGSGCTDADNVGGGGSASPSLSIDEAWRYCCDRRSDFPAMFAVYRHFRARGYAVHTGHKYGAHYVLYEGSPEECHSRYCVHVTGGGGGGDSWGHMKTVTRLMPDVAKCLLVCGVTYDGPEAKRQPPSEQQVEPGLPPLPPPLLPPVDTSSLAALAVADVTALRFSRSKESDGGGKSATTVLKVRRPATLTQSTFCGEGSRQRKQARKLARKSGGNAPDR